MKSHQTLHITNGGQSILEVDIEGDEKTMVEIPRTSAPGALRVIPLDDGMPPKVEVRGEDSIWVSGMSGAYEMQHKTLQISSNGVSFLLDDGSTDFYPNGEVKLARRSTRSTLVVSSSERFNAKVLVPLDLRSSLMTTFRLHNGQMSMENGRTEMRASFDVYCAVSASLPSGKVNMVRVRLTPEDMLPAAPPVAMRAMASMEMERVGDPEPEPTYGVEEIAVPVIASIGTTPETIMSTKFSVEMVAAAFVPGNDRPGLYLVKPKFGSCFPPSDTVVVSNGAVLGTGRSLYGFDVEEKGVVRVCSFDSIRMTSRTVYKETREYPRPIDHVDVTLKNLSQTPFAMILWLDKDKLLTDPVHSSISNNSVIHFDATTRKNFKPFVVTLGPKAEKNFDFIGLN